MKIYDCQQQTDAWYGLRLGKITASHFADVLNKKTGRETYMMRLLAERVTGLRQESYSNSYMEDGIEREPEARLEYTWQTGRDVREVGFVEKTQDVGCSPDGLVDSAGLLEIKCPKLTTHLGYIIKNVLPATYKHQVQGQLWVCERTWCDFVSYHPDYEKQPLWILRVERDDEYLALLSAAVSTFLIELEAKEKKL